MFEIIDKTFAQIFSRDWDMKAELSSQIFVNNTLNLFTDASIEPLDDGGWNGCSGVYAITRNIEPRKNDEWVMTQSANIVNRKIIFNCTNNIAELYAILLGVEYAIQNQNKFTRINLFSDSRISVEALRDWIFNWIQYNQYENSAYNPNVKTLINTSGVVKNQVLIKSIINAICCIDPNICSFNIYHCKGHATKIQTVQDSFLKFNGFPLNEHDASMLLKCNDIVDRATRDYLLSHEYDPKDIVSVKPFTIDPTPEMLKLYHSIVKGG